MDPGLRSPPLIEGDYIETVEGMLFAVKGLFHPQERVVAYLRYLPDPKGERRRGDRTYRRVYDLEETTETLRRRYPQYLSHVESRGLTLQMVPWSRIARIYRPRERLRSLMANPRNELERIVARFADALSTESGVPLEKFGVSGSVLIGLDTPSSDVDLIVYGADAGRRAYAALRRLRERSVWISAYDERTVEGVVKARWGDTGIGLERFRAIEMRKVLHGVVCGRDYFVRLVKEPGEVEAERSSEPLGRVRLRATISGHADSIFTPCTYQVEDCALLDADHQHEVSELVSFRGKFTEQAREGDAVEGRGMLERVRYDDRTVYRVVMGGRGDYLIPLGALDR